MNEDTMETAALVAWNYIGNKDCRMYRAHIHPHPDGNGFWCANIPCNCLVIESITIGTEDFKNTRRFWKLLQYRRYRESI